mgnify:CR=1 FL=1
MELKLKSPTSLDQIGKYAYVLKEEERVNGRKKSLGLLYIVPASKVAGIRSRYTNSPENTVEALIERAKGLRAKKFVDLDICRHPDSYRDLFSRLKMEVIDWTYFLASIEAYLNQFDTSEPGGETIHRLLGGFVATVRDHGYTEVA